LFNSLFQEPPRSKIAEVLKIASSLPRLTNEQQNVESATEVTKELKAILHSFKKAKSLVLDGWTKEFYLGFSDFLEEELIWVIEESGVSEKILGTLHATFIAPIPKKNNLETFDDYRPISLRNSVYKIIEKILANRLKSIFSGFMSETQFGFLYNRQIHNVVATAQ
jgi:hypothetical protein